MTTIPGSTTPKSTGPESPAGIDASGLARALEAANIPTLIPVLFQLTGDKRWLRAPYAPLPGRGMDDNTSGGLAQDVQREIRAATFQAVMDWASGRPVAVPAPRGAALTELMSVCMGEPITAEFEPMMADMLGFAPARPDQRVPGAERFDVVVIGAGVSGMAAALHLRAIGITVTVLEKNGDVGGTWLENAYPGAGVDTPSYLYSLSFAEHKWSTHFGKREEVQAYLRDVADNYDLRRLIRFRTEVATADWDDDGG